MQQEIKKNILIIDDDKMVADFLDVLLTNQGYLTAVADSAEAGLVKLEEKSCDLVLCDIFMEGMGGIDGIVTMRRLKPDIPIVAMSAGYNDMEPEEALKAAKLIGAVGVLAKPFDSKQVLSEVEVAFIKSEQR